MKIINNKIFVIKEKVIKFDNEIHKYMLINIKTTKMQNLIRLFKEIGTKIDLSKIKNNYDLV